MPTFTIPESDGATLREFNQHHDPHSGEFSSGGGGSGAKKKRTTSSDLLNQTVNYGGVPTRRGDVIKDLQRMGAPQAQIDRYMQGLDTGAKAHKKSIASSPMAPHQQAFHDRIKDLTSTTPGSTSAQPHSIMDVTTVTPTPTGLRYKTLDSHAASVIKRTADRVGHRNTQRYDNQTGHYIAHVSTNKKR